MRLDLYQLRAFFEAVRSGSYTEAARRLHVTQSAVSHAVAKLEASAGHQLVRWRARRMALTAEGEALRQTCERIFAELDAVEERLLGRTGPLARTFRMGAPVEFGATVLLGKLRPLVEAHPELHLDFFFSHHLLQPLLRGDVDLAIDCHPHTHPALERTVLFREQYVVIAAPSFLARNRLASPLDLARVPVLSMDEDGAWWDPVLEVLTDEQRPTLGRVVTINYLAGIVHATREGYGVGLVPRYTVLEELAEGSLRVLFEGLPLLEDRFFVYQRRAVAGRPVNLLVTRFLLSLDAGEFGDALGRVAGDLSPPQAARGARLRR